MLRKYTYLLAGLALLVSCSREQDVATEVSAEDAVPIRFSAGIAHSDVNTKGLGPLDDWNAIQDLYIYCIAREGRGNEASADAPLDLTNGIYIDNVKAESAPAPNGSPSIIREPITVYRYPELQEYYYYEPDRRYEFFGYYVDDAVDDPQPVVGESDITLPFVIDGSQDILLASTDKQADANAVAGTVIFDRLYSAYSARKELVPNLVFEHQLSRFNVNIRSGSNATLTGKLKVDHVRVESPTEGTLVIARKVEKTHGGIVDPDEPKFLDIQRGGHALSLADDITPTASWSNLGAVMVMPGDEVYRMKLGMTQEGYSINGGVVEKDLDIDLTTLEGPGAPVAEPGRQYDINVVVYGLEEVRVTVSLVQWEDGGELFVDPDDGDEAVVVPAVVDLGLSVKWATSNLCESGLCANPEDYGDYYAWGEVESYYSSQDPLTWKTGKTAGYSWASYKWCMGSEDTMTKYCNDSSYGYNGFTDTKTVLDPEDDVAHVKLGDSWRMPTDAEWTELRESCTWTWTDDYNGTGVSGRIVTSNIEGYTDKSIFLPAAGYRFAANLTFAGSLGFYWSSSRNYPSSAFCVSFSSGSASRTTFHRFRGFSARSVYDDSVHPASVSLNKASMTLSIGDTEQLTATVAPAQATNKSITWSSTDTAVAAVDSDGVVTAVASGTATITVETVDGGLTATCTVTVQNTPHPGGNEGIGGGEYD